MALTLRFWFMGKLSNKIVPINTVEQARQMVEQRRGNKNMHQFGGARLYRDGEWVATFSYNARLWCLPMQPNKGDFGGVLEYEVSTTSNDLIFKRPE